MKEHDEKLEAGTIVVQNRFVRWLDNLWYHYKWHIILIAFFAIVFGVGFAQCATADHPNAMVTYAGGYTLSAKESEDIGALFSNLLSKKNGETEKVKLNHYPIYTEDELRAMCIDPKTGHVDSFAYSSENQGNQDHIRTFQSFCMTGENAVWLVSEWVYGNLIDDDQRLVPLEQVLGYTPENAYNPYAIRLADTEFYRYYEVLQLLPEDTLLVFASGTVMGATSDAEVYELYKQLFRAIVEFRPN